MGNNFQKNKAKKSAFSDKSPKDISKGSTNSLKPVFSFEFMQDNTGYSVNCCDEEHKAAISATLFKLSQLNWQDIQNSNRHKIGHEIIQQSQIKYQLPSIVTEDTNILAFRYHSKAAMLGYREDRLFNILFIDHDFTLYNHD